MRSLIAIAALMASGTAFAQASDPIALYVATAQTAFNLAMAGDSGAYRKPEMNARYEAAMSAAKNAEQRKALVMLKAATGECVASASRYRGYDEDYQSIDDRNQPCKDKLADRAAAIEAAGYGN